MKFMREDREGVTDISMKALQAIFNDGEDLEKITIEPAGVGHRCDFAFKSGSHYVASGFSVGYGGTGPNGLHRTIRLWDKSLNVDFWETAIQSMNPMWRWTYQPGKGFGILSKQA